LTVTVRYARQERYRASPINGVMAPLVPVRLQSGGRSADTLGLVDSGADLSMFNAAFAVPLGIDLSLYPDDSSSGLGGSVPVKLVPIRMVVFGKSIDATVQFGMAIPQSFGLLGRADFFGAFSVGFNQRNLQVLLHPLP